MFWGRSPVRCFADRLEAAGIVLSSPAAASASEAGGNSIKGACQFGGVPLYKGCGGTMACARVHSIAIMLKSISLAHLGISVSSPIFIL